MAGLFFVSFVGCCSPLQAKRPETGLDFLEMEIERAELFQFAGRKMLRDLRVLF
jgi:hypothetical protein